MGGGTVKGEEGRGRGEEGWEGRGGEGGRVGRCVVGEGWWWECNRPVGNSRAA